MTSPRSGSSDPTDSKSNWNLVMLVFVERGKQENPGKTLGVRTRTNNKLNPHMGHIGERRVLSPLGHLCSVKMKGFDGITFIGWCNA